MKKAAKVQGRKVKKPLGAAAKSRARKSVKTGSPSFFKGSASKQLNYRTTNIVEDEYLVDIDGSEDFRVTRFPVNPGQSVTFPWLSTIAPNFEKYRFKMLEFYYKPIVSGFATAGQKGKIIFSFDTDAADPSPTTKRQMENTIPHSDATPWESFSMRLQSSIINRMTDAHYVRSGGVPSGTDIKTYDIGTLYVGTQGMVADSGKVGELRVRYSVDLLIPILEEVETPSPTFHVFSGYDYSTVDGGGLLTNPLLLPQGSAELINASSLTVDVNGLNLTPSGTSVELPVGIYFVTYNYVWRQDVGTQLNNDYVCTSVKNSILLSDDEYHPGQTGFAPTATFVEAAANVNDATYTKFGSVGKSFPLVVSGLKKKFEIRATAVYNGGVTPPSQYRLNVTFFTVSIWLM